MNHLIHVRLMLALAIAAAVGVLGFSHAGSETRNTQAGADAVADTAAVESIPTLPTVFVRADAEIPTLPLVVVRAHATDVAEQEMPLVAASTSSANPAMSLPDVLPHVRLDMPYYSFGKLLPRAIKE